MYMNGEVPGGQIELQLHEDHEIPRDQMDNGTENS